MTELDFEQIQLIPKFQFLELDKHETKKTLKLSLANVHVLTFSNLVVQIRLILSPLQLDLTTCLDCYRFDSLQT